MKVMSPRSGSRSRIAKLPSRESEAAWTVIDRIRERNADKDPDEVLRDVTAEVEAVRQVRYEKGRTGIAKTAPDPAASL
jgi:hypothetical protein